MAYLCFANRFFSSYLCDTLVSAYNCRSLLDRLWYIRSMRVVQAGPKRMNALPGSTTFLLRFMPSTYPSVVPSRIIKSDLYARGNHTIKRCCGFSESTEGRSATTFISRGMDFKSGNRAPSTSNWSYRTLVCRRLKRASTKRKSENTSQVANR